MAIRTKPAAQFPSSPAIKLVASTIAQPATNPADAPLLSLPQHGMSRWNDIAPFSPVCREIFRRLVLAGKAPQPVKFTKRCTAYHNSELHRWLADPLNYRAEVK